MDIHPLVTDTATLARITERMRRAEFVTIDTEFMRENSYYPELCLVQLGTHQEAAAIDPKAPGLDLAPLLDLLADEQVLKVLHAGGQDIEIFVHLTGRVPQPLFDTQVAAMALGLGEQASYAALVARYTGHQVDKGARFTDWARRPLMERQIRYAIGDVTHLAELFPTMLEQLRRGNRGQWLDEEMARLSDPSNFLVDPERAWQRLKLPGRKPDLLGRIKALAKWRELEAMSRNIPRGRIIKDETLLDLAQSPPKSQADLAQVRGLSAGWGSNSMGARLMEVLRNAAPLDASELPAREPQRAGLSGDGALVADLLKLLLKIRAKEAQVAPKLLARSDDLEALAAGQRDGLPLLEGWRREIFGNDALALVEGRIGFTVERGCLCLSRIAPAPGHDG
ncbi:MAG: ribonuclease D [Thermaurantiacus sp.]